ESYAGGYNNVGTLLGKVKAAITAERAREQAMMVTTLSILTGGIVGVFADGLVAKFPKLTGQIWDLKDGVIQAVVVAKDDPIMFKLLKAMMKDTVTQGSKLASTFGVAALQGAPPSDGFSAVGMTVEAYRNLLSEGIINRADCLCKIVDVAYQLGDTVTLQTANAMRKGLLQSDFFAQPYRASKNTLQNKAELALWCAWALPRDEEYWSTQAKLTPFIRDTANVDFAPVRARLHDLGVPDRATAIAGSTRSWGIFTTPVNGLDVISFRKWVKTPDMPHTLFEGIPVTEAKYSWASGKLLQANHDLLH